MATQKDSTALLLIVTALIEAPTGLVLLVSPPLVARILLGAALDAPAALVVGRMAGAALFSLSGACWLARDEGPSRAVGGLVVALLLYNCAAVAVLARAAISETMVGVLMWPVLALHTALAVWCLVCLRRGSVNAAAPTR